MSGIMIKATLDRVDNSTPWGFRLQGGKDFSALLTIARVTPGSLAEKCGLQTGDVIMKIGNEDTSMMKHKEAQEIIIRSGNKVEFILQRGSGVPQPEQKTVSTVSFNPSLPPLMPPLRPNPTPAPFVPAPTTVSIKSEAPAAPEETSFTLHISTETSSVSSEPFNTAPKPFSPVDSVTSKTSNLSINTPQSPQSGVSTPAAKPFSPPVPKPSSAAPSKWQPTKPTGPRNPKLGKRGEAQFQQPATGMKIPICSSCGTPIRGPFVLALGKSWCPDHFICANPTCGIKLIDIGFVEENSQLYCEKDFEKFFAPECSSCKRAIVGDVVNALERQWHTQCFVCTQCKGPITSGSFHIENGVPYCENDWFALFQTKCAGCDFPIEPGDRCVEALSLNFHSECFNCSTCQVNLEGKPFVPRNNRPYCQKHAR